MPIASETIEVRFDAAQIGSESVKLKGIGAAMGEAFAQRMAANFSSLMVKQIRSIDTGSGAGVGVGEGGGVGGGFSAAAAVFGAVTSAASPLLQAQASSMASQRMAERTAPLFASRSYIDQYKNHSSAGAFGEALMENSYLNFFTLGQWGNFVDRNLDVTRQGRLNDEAKARMGNTLQASVAMTMSQLGDAAGFIDARTPEVAKLIRFNTNRAQREEANRELITHYTSDMIRGIGGD